jgi:hypothetical protein
MATYNKFFDFVEQLSLAKHQLNTDVLKIYLSNTTPDQTLDTIKTDLAEFAGGTGYTTGGEDTQNTFAETGGTGTLTGTKVVWTATAADWSAFRYVVLYNDTQTSPVDPLIAWWDYGSALTLGNGETFTVKFNNGATTGTIFTIA